MLLAPPKHDWQNFHQLTVGQLMWSAERDLFAARTTPARPHQDALQPLLFYLQPSVLAAACPGVRCDGMHMGASFSLERAVVECHSNIFLLEAFLAEFLVATRGLSSGDGEQCREPSSDPGGRVEDASEAFRRCLRAVPNFTGW